MATKTYPLYYVEWFDHWSPNEGGWIQPQTIKPEPIIACTVGWKVAEDKHGILIAGSICQGNGDYSGITYILKGVVVSKKQLSPSMRVSHG